jgi:hypothetical protein
VTTADEECELLLRPFFFVGVRSVLVRKANETREHRSVHERSNALGGKCCCMDYESTWFFRMRLKRACGGACELGK